MAVFAEEGPPAFVALAAYLGLRRPRRRAAEPIDFDAFMRALAPNGAG